MLIFLVLNTETEATLPRTLRLFLCGDVMTGRGIDQVLPHPVDPVLYESYVKDAREYVTLAEKANGPISRPVRFDYVWGDALKELKEPRLDLRIINLETSITSSPKHWSDKEIHYRMHPENVGCLTAAHIDACALSNNHVLDWGYDGLAQTLQTLNSVHIACSGAGNDLEEAMAPARMETEGKGRVLFFSLGSMTSGIPPDWRARNHRPGVYLLPDLSDATAEQTASHMRRFHQAGDVIVASIHWGDNWGHAIPRDQISFAHRLIDEGAAIIHGHSSHHVKGIEVYRQRLILYGCGDILTDYEGISGHESFRGDLALMYLVEVEPRTGHLMSLRMAPMQTRRFRLNHASAADTEWLHSLLNRLGEPLGTHAALAADNSLSLTW